MLNYKIIKSKRKTIVLRITENGSLEVRAPWSVSDAYLKGLISDKADWIAGKIREMAGRRKFPVRKEFAVGEKFLYLGEYYKLKLVGDSGILLYFQDGFFLFDKARPLARSLFVKWYKNEAKRRFAARVADYADRLGLRYEKIKVNNARSRWGSCSHRGNLNFSWRLIMAPPRVFEYVVAHEVIHLIEKNHSRRFWNQVGRIMPDYKEQRKWLRDNGHTLDI